MSWRPQSADIVQCEVRLPCGLRCTEYKYRGDQHGPPRYRYVNNRRPCGLKKFDGLMHVARQGGWVNVNSMGLEISKDNYEINCYGKILGCEYLTIAVSEEAIEHAECLARTPKGRRINGIYWRWCDEKYPEPDMDLLLDEQRKFLAARDYTHWTGWKHVRKKEGES